MSESLAVKPVVPADKPTEDANYKLKESSALSRLDFGINRSALAPVGTAETGANALRLISPTHIKNLG